MDTEQLCARLAAHLGIDRERVGYEKGSTTVRGDWIAVLGEITHRQWLDAETWVMRASNGRCLLRARVSDEPVKFTEVCPRCDSRLRIREERHRGELRRFTRCADRLCANGKRERCTVVPLVAPPKLGPRRFTGPDLEWRAKCEREAKLRAHVEQERAAELLRRNLPALPPLGSWWRNEMGTGDEMVVRANLEAGTVDMAGQPPHWSTRSLDSWPMAFAPPLCVHPEQRSDGPDTVRLSSSVTVTGRNAADLRAAEIARLDLPDVPPAGSWWRNDTDTADEVVLEVGLGLRSVLMGPSPDAWEGRIRPLDHWPHGFCPAASAEHWDATLHGPRQSLTVEADHERDAITIQAQDAAACDAQHEALDAVKAPFTINGVTNPGLCSVRPPKPARVEVGQRWRFRDEARCWTVKRRSTGLVSSRGPICLLVFEDGENPMAWLCWEVSQGADSTTCLAISF